MNHAKIADFQARMAAFSAELADIVGDTDTDPPAADPGVEILNLAKDSDRDEPKPTSHTKADGLAEARRRFPGRPSTAPGDEGGDEGSDEPVGDSARARGLQEAARRFGKRGGSQ